MCARPASLPSAVKCIVTVCLTHDDVLRLAKKVLIAQQDTELRFCYEAGTHGDECIVVAPAKVARSSATT